MKKPIKHKCDDCGNVYYYRNVRDRRKCPVCGGQLSAEGYQWIEAPGSHGVMIQITKFPPPPVRRGGSD